MNFKQLLSYLVPIKIYETKSAINKNLEITWNNGKLVLDSENTNFSYGNLQKVLRCGLKEIGYEKILFYENILILGVAGGSVIKTLVNEIKYKGAITGVEIDLETILLAKKYFKLDQVKNLDIIIADAEIFVTQTKITYDLIIIDIFQDNIMPNFLFESSFIENIFSILNKKGFVLFNTIVSNNSSKIRNENFVKFINLKKHSLKRLPNIEGDNELLIFEK